jgi:hypothetical protein
MKKRNIMGYNCRIKNYIFVFVLLLLCYGAYGQATTQGKDFWVSFGGNGDELFSSVDLQIRVVTTKATVVKFTFSQTGYAQSVSLTAGSVYTKKLTESEKAIVYADVGGVFKRSLHIESDEDIAVYAINLVEYTTDATCILPVNAYDTSYYHLSYNGVYYDGYVIVATEDNTTIYENDYPVAVLDRGNTFSKYFLNNISRHVTSDKPVAYFTANKCVNVPADVDACDCLYEQLLPESLWGVSFMAPVTVRGIERVRVYASQDNTTVTHSGGTVEWGSLSLNKGEYVELEIDILDAGCYIESDKPVAVMSYLTGLDYFGLDYMFGDPAMAWVPSVDQFVTETTIAPFVASESSVIEEHHILIITAAEYKKSVRLSVGNDGYSSLSGGSWFDHPSGYSFYSMPLAQADKSYSFKNPAGLAIMGYGLGTYESYYYLAGSALRRLNASLYVNGIHNQDMEGQTLCSDNIMAKAVVRYEMHAEQGHLRWFIDDMEMTDLEDILEWNRSLPAGLHEISMIVRYKEGSMDTARSSFTVELPDLNMIGMADTTVCKWSKVKLQIENASEEYVYSWFYDEQYMDTIIKASFIETDVLLADTVFYLEVASNKKCTVRDTVKVTVNSLFDLICRDTAVCYNTVATPGALTADDVSLTWYSDANYSGVIVSENSFETSALTVDTVFYVEAVSVDGCRLRDSVRVFVFPFPELAVDDVEICYNRTATLTATSSDVVSVTWYSDADYTGIIVNSNPFETPALTVDTVFYVEALLENGCISRGSAKVTVHPFPELTVKNRDTVCRESSVRLEAASSDAVSWYSDCNFSDLIGDGVSFLTGVLTVDTVFRVSSTSREGCITRDSVNVVTVSPPAVVAMDDSHLCYGEKVDLSRFQSVGLISWNVDTITKNPVLTNRYIVTASRPPCPDARDTVIITFGDSLYILPAALPEYLLNIEYSQQFTSNAESPRFSVYKGVLPSGLFLSPAGMLSGTNFQRENAEGVTFTVKVEDVYKCTAFKEYAFPSRLFIPKTSFDCNGINDVFMRGFEIIIFDRLGIEIFRGDDGWDGTNKGNPAPEDIYFYSLRYKNTKGEFIVKQGYVGLIIIK